MKSNLIDIEARIVHETEKAWLLDTGGDEIAERVDMKAALSDALDEIDRLTAENERLREALRPFAYWTIGRVIADSPKNKAKYPVLLATIMIARAALGEQT